MSAQIIKFPSKKSVVLNDKDDKTKVIKGVEVKEPKTRIEYLDICKNFLDPFDYQDILCGIMDEEHYDTLEQKFRNIVDSYYQFPK